MTSSPSQGLSTIEWDPHVIGILYLKTKWAWKGSHDVLTSSMCVGPEMFLSDCFSEFDQN